MKIATHKSTGVAFEGYMLYTVFFMSRKVGSDDLFQPRDEGGFFEWRNWTLDDYNFNT